MDHRVSKDMISSGMTPSGEKSQSDLGKSQYGSAPSPNRLMDAYHSMYQNQKEETLDEKLSSDDIRRFNQMGQNAAKVEKKNVNRAIKDERRERVQKTYDQAREQGLTDGVDLLAAYRAVYEHHQKDENGNTIPHEDDVKEGKINPGLQAFLDKKKGKKVDKKDKKKVKKGKGGKPDFLDLDKDGDKKEPMKKASKEMKEDYDLVYNHFIEEGFSEEETYERMLNLTEEQLDEFMKMLAARAAQYGSNLGKKGHVTGFLNQRKNKETAINVIDPKEPKESPRKPFEPVKPVKKTTEPVARKPFEPEKPKPKPGDSNFRAKSASEVMDGISAVKAARAKKEAEDRKIKIRKGEVMQDSYDPTSNESDVFDAVLNQLIEEGYSEKESYEIMSNLTEEQLNEFIVSGTMAALGALKAGGAALAAKGAAAAKGALAAAKASKVGTSVGKGLTKLKGIAKNQVSQFKKDPMKKLGQAADLKFKTDIITGGGGGSNTITPLKRTGQVSTGSNIASSADLFDIVKGQLLDEGLSEEEIKNIMLELTPEEILNEISVDKMSNYMSAANKDVQKTSDSIRKDGSVMGSDPRVKRLDKRATGMARAGQKIADKLKPKDTFLNMGQK